MTAQNAAQANAKDAVAATQGLQAQVDPIIEIYKRFVQATYANATPTLADFGIAPPKVRAPRTAEQKAASAAKAAATRKARGTAGKKQKAAVKGNVAGITVTPITTQIVPSPSAQPASPAPNAAPTGTASK